MEGYESRVQYINQFSFDGGVKDFPPRRLVMRILCPVNADAAIPPAEIIKSGSTV